MSTGPTTMRWQSIGPSERVEIGLIHVDVAYDRELVADYTPAEMESLRAILKDSFLTIAEHRGGKLYSWDAAGGAFMFLAEGEESYDNCCLAATQMLEMMVSFNEDVRHSKEVVCPVQVLIAGDAGTVAYDPEPANMPGDFAARLARQGRAIGAASRLTITDRVYRRLSRAYQARFVSWKYSAELDATLYRAPPSEAPRGGKAAPAAGERMPIDKRLRGAVARLRPWQLVVLFLGAMLVADFFVVRALIPATPPKTEAAAAVAPPAPPPWEEEVYSADWAAWRKRTHEELSTAHSIEQALASVVRARPAAPRNPPAAALRHDQAIGAALLTYPRVKEALRVRLGIYDTFLGTGLSNPVNARDYGHAALHEYLVENLREEDPRLLTLKFKPYSVEFETRVKDLIEEHKPADEAKQKLKQVIKARAEGGEPDGAVIRFAIVDEKKYKGTFGRPEAVRVFASSLAEVWNLKVKDAADRSGYSFRPGGDTFLFIGVFVPAHKEEAVLATWSRVLERLPEWMEEAQNKRP